MIEHSPTSGAMCHRMIALALGVALCACASSQTQLATQRATANFAPSQREEFFARALSVLQRRGWPIATSDEAAGLITTEWMQSGMKPCGTAVCDSKSMVQVSIASSGSIEVKIRRELDTLHMWMPSGREGSHNWQEYVSDRDAEELLGEMRRGHDAIPAADAG